MKITAENIEIVLALKFDVDITPEAANLILPEAQEFAWEYDREYHRDKQAQERYFKNCGISEETYVEVGDRRENALIMFLIPLIGQPIRLPDDRHRTEGFKYVESEYRQKHGSVLDVKDLPEKKWKSFAEIQQPPKKTGSRKKYIPVEPSEKLLKLNRLLTESGCLETTIVKFQMQLQIIADSDGIEPDEMEFQTNGSQTFFTIERNGRTLSVDLLPIRCAIRLYGKSGIIEKIYARKPAQCERAAKWLLG